MIIKKELPEIPKLESPIVEDISLNTVTLAMIINGVVHQVIGYSEEFSQVLLSNPKFIQVDFNTVKQGYIYNPENSTFSHP